MLLVFFILATAMSVLEKVLDIPESKMEKAGKVRVVKCEDVISTTIMVMPRKEGGQTVIKLGDKPVALENVQNHLDALMMDGSPSGEMIIEAEGVEWEVIVALIDAAGGVGIRKVQFVKKQGGPTRPHHRPDRSLFRPRRSNA